VTERDVEPVTWAVIQRGRSLSGVQHYSDIQAARAMGRAFVGDLDRYDVFLTPTLTQLPRPVGFYDMSETDLDSYHAKWSDAVFGFPVTMSGLPAISLPLGVSRGGVPIGVQAIGRYGDEATLLSLATVLEQEMPWRGRRPPVCA
jgi:amidase